MENNDNPQSELIMEDVAKLLSRAQTFLEEQALFGQYIYSVSQEVVGEKENNTIDQQQDFAPLLTKQTSGAAEDLTFTTVGAGLATPAESLFAPLMKEATITSEDKSQDKSQKKEQSLSNWQNCASLPLLYDAIHTCLECPLGATRKNFVFGSGNPNADVMIIGEAPGADEDAQGLPFVGAAGQLLTKILAAIGFSREEVYIANILKCRPPGNRTPEKSETDKCEPYLLKQIELIKPKFILAVGLTAANTLLKTSNKMGEIRGKTFDYHGVTMLVTYHPAALLRNPNWKTATWEDVKLLRRMYDQWREEV